MADRVKYFLLGLLFLVVAGVIAFDRWNSREAMGPGPAQAQGDEEEEAELWFRPPARDVEESGDADDPVLPDDRGDPAGGNASDASGPLRLDPPDNRTLRIDPRPEIIPAPKPDPKPEPKRTPASDTIHVVQSGETLGEIAARYYPGRVQSGIRLIAEANKITNPNRIRENAKLVIPASSVRAPARTPVVKSNARGATATAGVPSTYKVRAGDGDLYAICRRFYGRKGEGARIVRIMEMNDLVSTRVPKGTVLKLPPK